MARKLTTIEKCYIENNRNLSINEITKEMPGVGPKTIKAYIESLPPVIAEVKTDDKGKSILQNKTEEEQKAIVNDTDAHRAGNLMARRDGIVIMTEAAAELSDARRKLRVPQDPKLQAKNADRIHRIK